MIQLEAKPDWGLLATFVPNKKEYIYNWFYYKEGYARELVEKVIDIFQIKKGQTVFDPFCGSGTTLLACKQNGINSIGYDVLPISVFASMVKTRNYEKEKLQEAARELFRNKFERPEKIDVPSIMKRAFSKYALEDIIFFKKKMRNIEPETRDFMLLALVNAAMKVSWAWKDGGVIKIKNRRPIPLRPLYKRVVKNMIRSIGEKKDADACVKYGDARKTEIDDGSIDAVITSPPYLNNIDYTKVYEIEDWMVRGVMGEPEPAVRSYIGTGREINFLEEMEIPNQARAYFCDMNMVLKELYRVCRSGAGVCLVVGNAFFTDIRQHVESDIILAELAEKIGFETEHVYIMNEREALVNRTIKHGKIRESAVILKKK